MAPANHSKKSNSSASKSSKSSIKKPARRTCGKNQLLISRFFGSEAQVKPRNVTPPAVTTSTAEVKLPEPISLSSKSIDPVPTIVSVQPKSDVVHTSVPMSPTRDSKAKRLSFSSSAAEEGAVDIKLPRKRVRLHAGFYDEADAKLEEASLARRASKCRSGAGDDENHSDDDPAFEYSPRLEDSVAGSMGSDLMSEEEGNSANDEHGAENSQERSPFKPRSSVTLISYESHRSSGEVDKCLPRDSERQQRFKQKMWPFGKKTRGLQGADDVYVDDGCNEKRSVSQAPSKGKNYTPLESQFVALRNQHPKMLLVVECGYKYRMFDSDASVASKVLRIAAYFDRNFLTASFPTHRLAYHVNRLVQAGYKVGVVNQNETAALKKANNKASTLFERKLESVFTKGTMIADARLKQSVQVAGEGNSVKASSYIMAILEVDHEGSNSSSVLAQEIAFAAVDSVTGRISCDTFIDDVLRSEMVSRLTALEPVEILVSNKRCSQSTELVVKAFTAKSGCRIERMKASNFQENEALTTLNKAVEAQFKDCEYKLKAIQRCLGALLNYLDSFGLRRFLTNSSQFSLTRSCRQMSLGADVLHNFEVLGNSNNGSVQGSLYALLNRTRTCAGSRQMRQWLCHPLVAPRDIIHRIEVVDYLRSHLSCDSMGEAEPLPSTISELIASLPGLPDLEQGVLRMSCQKCSPSEFLVLIRAFEDIGAILDRIRNLLHPSTLPALLHRMISDTPSVREILRGTPIACLNPTAAKNDTYHEVFLSDKLNAEPSSSDNDMFRSFLQDAQRLESSNHDLEIQEQSMSTLLRKLRKEHAFPEWEWKKVAKEEFLLEVSVSKASSIPRSWPLISQTKAVKRFRPPQALRGYENVLCARELREAVSFKCWQSFLELFAAFASPLRVVVKTLVDLDCLSALASVANLPGYSKPEIEPSEDALAGVVAEDARHPMGEILQLSNGYVPNNVRLGNDQEKIGLIISGPNYGGKSSYARMVGLLAILAQVGSFVPARNAKIAPFDSIYTRMGSKDSIGAGLSSLMVELTETSRIFRMASSRSLVVIDELGRGTSTHDGTAIAYSTLAHLVEKVRCVTIFITHYPAIATLLKRVPELLDAYYMNYREETEHQGAKHSKQPDSSAMQSAKKIKITFLYRLTEGVASCSYGLNVAQLASVPETVVDLAREKAFEFENKIEESKKDCFLAKLLNEANWHRNDAITNVLDIASNARKP